MKNHLIIIKAEQQNDDETSFHADISVSGNHHILSQAIAASLRNDPRFQQIFMEALINLIAGTKFETVEHDVHEHKKPIKGD